MSPAFTRPVPDRAVRRGGLPAHRIYPAGTEGARGRAADRAAHRGTRGRGRGQPGPFGGRGAAGLKTVLTTAVNDLLAPIRARRAEYARDLGYVRQVLREGNERANEIASVTLAEVQAAMGMRY